MMKVIKQQVLKGKITTLYLEVDTGNYYLEEYDRVKYMKKLIDKKDIDKIIKG